MNIPARNITITVTSVVGIITLPSIIIEVQWLARRDLRSWELPFWAWLNYTSTSSPKKNTRVLISCCINYTTCMYVCVHSLPSSTSRTLPHEQCYVLGSSTALPPDDASSANYSLLTDHLAKWACQTWEHSMQRIHNDQ